MASRTAAKSDETADNSIGNITGSILAAVVFRYPSRRYTRPMDVAGVSLGI